jgi:hypothetical protein
MDWLYEIKKEDDGGPTWIRTRTRRKIALVSKHERFLNFSAEDELAA